MLGDPATSGGLVDLLNRRNVVFAVTTVLGLVADLASKFWIEANVAYATQEIPVIPGLLSIVHAQNPGAAFGALGEFAGRHVVFGVFTVIALFVVADMFRKLPRTDWYSSLALGLILSGALGNAVDRIRQGHVTDFIRVYSDNPSIKDWLIRNFGTYEWPSFNIADSTLVVGVLLFMLHWAVVERFGRRPQADSAATG